MRSSVKAGLIGGAQGAAKGILWGIGILAVAGAIKLGAGAILLGALASLNPFAIAGAVVKVGILGVAGIFSGGAVLGIGAAAVIGGSMMVGAMFKGVNEFANALEVETEKNKIVTASKIAHEKAKEARSRPIKRENYLAPTPNKKQIPKDIKANELPADWNVQRSNSRSDQEPIIGESGLPAGNAHRDERAILGEHTRRVVENANTPSQLGERRPQ
jgi:hypothetical protein